MSEAAVARPAVRGTVESWPRNLLRIEGLCIFASTIWAYSKTGLSWWIFAGGLLLPDLGMAGYLKDSTLGAALYNTVHTESLPVLLFCTGYARSRRDMLGAALVWLAHINMDRMFGFGLKYGTAFGHTHLGWIGKKEDDPQYTDLDKEVECDYAAYKKIARWNALPFIGLLKGSWTRAGESMFNKTNLWLAYYDLRDTLLIANDAIETRQASSNVEVPKSFENYALRAMRECDENAFNMPLSTDDIVGLRQQIQDNMKFLRPDVDHTVLLVKSGGDYQVAVMETGVAYNKAPLVAFGARMGRNA